MDIGDILAFIVAIIQSVVDFIVQVADILFNIIVDVWNTLVSVINDVWSWLGTIWSSLKDFFDDLWWEVIIPFIEWCQEIIDDITTWLANFLDPIITWVNRILAWYNQYIAPILKGVLEVIQRMRVFLSILKLLGVKWAAKLDADLQLIQSWITTIMLDITRTLNTITNVIGLMVDPTGILRRDFFGNTLFSSIGGIKRATGFGTDRVSTPGELTRATQNQAMVTGTAPTATLNSDGTISFLPGVSDINDAVSKAMSDLGQTPLPN